MGRHGRPLGRGDDRGGGRKGSFSQTRQRVTTNPVKTPQELPFWTTLARAFGPSAGMPPNDGRIGGSPSLPPADISKHAGPGGANLAAGDWDTHQMFPFHLLALEPRTQGYRALLHDRAGRPSRLSWSVVKDWWERLRGRCARVDDSPASPLPLPCSDRPAGSPLH